MKNISKLAIDIGHNVNFDGGAVGIKREDVLNYEVGTKLIEKWLLLRHSLQGMPMII